MAIQLGRIAPDFDQDSSRGRIRFHEWLGNPGGVDALQLTDAHKVSTPANWTRGKQVIISPSLSNEDAKQRFPGGRKELRPYLRMIDQPPLPR